MWLYGHLIFNFCELRNTQITVIARSTVHPQTDKRRSLPAGLSPVGRQAGNPDRIALKTGLLRHFAR